MVTEAHTFLSSLESNPAAYLTPDLPLHTDILRYLKHTLDPIAARTSTLQQTRLQEARKKRKRGDATLDNEVLRLRQIHIDGFGVQQVWEQTRRVIDATRKEAELGLLQAEDAASDDEEMETGEESDLGQEGVDYIVEGEDNEDDVDMEGSAEDEDLDSDGEITQEALEDDMELYSGSEEQEVAEEFVADKFGLNDGFFSIDSFNRQSEFLEQQDARGGDDGAASDEEEIDWDSNPLGQPAVVDAEESGDEEDGPTFGDPDASSEDEMEVDEGEMNGVDGLGNTNEVMYGDFFAPPAQKKNKKKKGRPNPHNFPAKEAVEDDVQRTIDAVQRDLFEDDDEDEEPEEQQQQLDPADPRSRKSAHERRQAAIAEEIRKLEAANVAKREWTMSGEARAADRPVNSLLEEDLEFERTGKPVPVITAEVSESIEELIKRRILAQDFQDIPRRRPNDLATGKRGRTNFELDDTKSKKGLAEEYEEEHLRQNDPNFVDAKDEKLAKEQKEIEALWKDVCAKLDSLSSWHFRPKQPTAQLDIRVDAPTIALEDARPNAGGDVAAASQLAPQEVYRAGEGSKAVNTEVVGKSGLPAGREELSRDEKKRRRRREKERIRKASGNETAKPQSKLGKERKQVVGDLKKGGVKIIGKKGEMTDVEGKASKSGSSNTITAANFKL